MFAAIVLIALWFCVSIYLAIEEAMEASHRSDVRRFRCK